MGRLAATVRCRCVFDQPDSYPHPLLHAHGVTVEAAPSAEPPIEEVLDALVRTEARLAALETERDDLRARVLARLAALPGGRLALGGATWAVESVEGIPVLHRTHAVGE